MKTQRMNIHLAAIALACAGLGSTALAQQQPTQGGPDRDRAVKQGVQVQGDKTNQGEAQGSTQRGNTASQAEVRDWQAIDKNNDHLVSPEEMEAALKEVGPQARKSSSSDKSK